MSTPEPTPVPGEVPALYVAACFGVHRPGSSTFDILLKGASGSAKFRDRSPSPLRIDILSSQAEPSITVSRTLQFPNLWTDPDCTNNDCSFLICTPSEFQWRLRALEIVSRAGGPYCSQVMLRVR